MKEFDLFGFQVEIDEVTTKEWYDNADEWGCDCGDCRHFVALAKKRKFPPTVLEILEQFGIAPEKATYVCEMITEEHKVLYQFSYRIMGNILKERDGDAKEFGTVECAITNHTNCWWFYDGVEQVEVCEFNDFKLLVSKVADYVVDDKTVQAVFDEGLYENISII